MYEKHVPRCQAHEVYSVMCVSCLHHFGLHTQACLTSDPGWGGEFKKESCKVSCYPSEKWQGPGPGQRLRAWRVCGGQWCENWKGSSVHAQSWGPGRGQSSEKCSSLISWRWMVMIFWQVPWLLIPRIYLGKNSSRVKKKYYFSEWIIPLWNIIKLELECKYLTSLCFNTALHWCVYT